MRVGDENDLNDAYKSRRESANSYVTASVPRDPSSLSANFVRSPPYSSPVSALHCAAHAVLVTTLCNTFAVESCPREAGQSDDS